jgi:hypothetical protein
MRSTIVLVIACSFMLGCEEEKKPAAEGTPPAVPAITSAAVKATAEPAPSATADPAKAAEAEAQ